MVMPSAVNEMAEAITAGNGCPRSDRGACETKRAHKRRFLY